MATKQEKWLMAQVQHLKWMLLIFEQAWFEEQKINRVKTLSFIYTVKVSSKSIQQSVDLVSSCKLNCRTKNICYAKLSIFAVYNLKHIKT